MVIGFEGGPCPRMLEAERMTFNIPCDNEQSVVGTSTTYSQEPITQDEFRKKFLVVCEYTML